MNFKKFAAAIAASSVIAAASTAAASTFVGSWTVDQGPSWTTVPPAYSGQEAAALLFGGSPSDYVISTVDNNPADVNDSNWVSTWGGACGGAFPCGTIVAQNFVQSTGGLYFTFGDTSAYVNDWAVGAQYTNYAFLATPEPATWGLMLIGFMGVGAMARSSRRRALVAS